MQLKLTYHMHTGSNQRAGGQNAKCSDSRVHPLSRVPRTNAPELRVAGSDLVEPYAVLVCCAHEVCVFALRTWGE